MQKQLLLNTPFLSRNIYIFLFSLLGVVYFIGLFVPLMDNDSAHHANIALRMYLTGDYVNLIDSGKDYLDKPHLHFWLCAISYEIFGVNSFAYKFPSFLFTLLGVYSTYRLGKSLYNSETGKLAALILASSFAFILANNDVRMDAILTASIAFATWQLVDFIQHKKLLNISGAALGMAIGFSTKGHIAVFVPAIAAIFYTLYRKEWKFLFTWKWLILIGLFVLFITPVVYCYYLQYNLHPQKTVRGNDHINGIKFILFSQSIERFSGKVEAVSKHDYFFFLHSFLWAFAPWSLLAYIAIAGRIRSFLNRKKEWLTTGVFITTLLLFTFSGFKLPHYLNSIFPTTSIMVSSFIINKIENPGWTNKILYFQSVMIFLLLLLILVINGWAFPIKSILVVAGLIFFLTIVFYFIKSSLYSKQQKNVLVPVAVMALFFFLLNSSFYPKLLQYQGGNRLASLSCGKINTANVFYWKNTFSSSFCFYTSILRQQFADTVLQKSKKTWLLYDIKDETEIKNAGYLLRQKFEAPDYEISKPDLRFINPQSREKQCTKMVLAEITKE